MANNIVNTYASTMITIFQDVVKNYEQSQYTVKQTEEELNDLYHEAELAAPKDMYKGYLIYKNIRDLRLKRREAKEQIELLSDLYDYVKSPAGANFKSTIQKIQGNSVKVRETQEKRTYVPRQRSDLTIINQTCTAHKPFDEMIKDFKQTKIEIRNGKLRK